MKGRISQSSVNESIADNSDGIVVEHVAPDRQERRNRAVKEREDKIKDERRRLDAEIEKSKSGINKEEGERIFMWVIHTLQF
jgi:transcription elongation regulator 1